MLSLNIGSAHEEDHDHEHHDHEHHEDEHADHEHRTVRKSSSHQRHVGHEGNATWDQVFMSTQFRRCDLFMSDLNKS